MTSEYLGRADEISIDTDEGAFVLWFTTEEGTYRVNVHGAASDLLEAVDRVIRPWWEEGESVRKVFAADMERAAFHCNPDESAGMDEGVVVAIREDGSYRIESDEDAYDPTDPKHPRYHSTHADVWDARDGK